MAHPDGNATLITQAPGYKAAVSSVSVPVIESVTKHFYLYPEFAFQDSYEEDDLADQAKVVFLDDTSQHHTFHDQGDSDWVKFYGLSGKTYDIRAENLEFNCDIVIEMFMNDGTTPIAGPINTSGAGGAESFQWLCQEDGIYQVKLQQFDPSDYGDNTGYELKANISFTNATGVIQGRITYALTQMPLSYAVIIARDSASNSAEQSVLSDSNGNFRMLCDPGTYTLQAIIDDTEFLVGNVTVAEGIVTQQGILFLPLSGDINGDVIIDLPDAIISMQVLADIESTETVYPTVDVNGDGRIGLEEVVYILHKISGLRQ